MKTTFQIGQEVVAKFDAQNLVEGRQYRVVDMDVRYMRGLTYVTYVLVDSLTENDGRFAVGNGHLILSAV